MSVSLFYYNNNYFGMYFIELLKLGCVEDRIMYLPRQQWSTFFFKCLGNLCIPSQ